MQIPIEDSEILTAEHNLNCKDPIPLNLCQMDSGAVALFSRGYFPWGGLPYPIEHARLGSLLCQLGQHELSEKMADWQRQTLDHYQRPIFSLLNQERSCTYEQLESAVFKFLTRVPKRAVLDEVVDHEIGMVRLIEGESTFLSIASGCKSGMGAYLFRDIGIINYGPQLLPIGDCASFGLAGRPRSFNFEQRQIRYQTRLAAPHPRNTGFPIQDSGYSGLWIEVEQSLEETTCRFQGSRSLESVRFSFFLKAPCLRVSGSHKLMPKSLDRYLGPPAPVLLEGGLLLKAISGASQMEVIPLAGDESFWGANFLVVFTISSPFRFSTEILL